VITDWAQAELQQMRAQEHANCIVCSPSNIWSLGVGFTASEDGVVEGDFDCGSVFEGYDGMLHGGVIASLLDGAMTNCLFAHGIPGVTAELSVRYRHPINSVISAKVRAWIERSSEPLYVLKAEIIQEGKTKATAVGKFMKSPPHGRG